MTLIEKYLQEDYIASDTSETIQKCVDELRAYVAGFPDVLKLTLTISGSHATGLASRADSMVDLIVKMEGKLTRKLDGDQLAVALSAGLNDWSFVTQVTPVEGNTALLLCKTKNEAIVLRVLACNTVSFPSSQMYHSRLINSYAVCDPRVPILITMVKRWARCYGFSSPIALETCPFSGFHWTILALYFLIETGIAPNLHHVGVTRRDDVTRIQYGPSPLEHVFALVTRQQCNPPPATEIEMVQITGRFFEWLSSVDLLSQVLCIKKVGVCAPIQNTSGWIRVMDPCTVTEVNTVTASKNQKNQIVFALKIRKAAKQILDDCRKEGEKALSTQLYAKRMIGGPGSRQKIDVAVP